MSNVILRKPHMFYKVYIIRRVRYILIVENWSINVYMHGATYIRIE